MNYFDSLIQINQTGGQPYSDTSPYEVIEYSLLMSIFKDL